MPIKRALPYLLLLALLCCAVLAAIRLEPSADVVLAGVESATDQDVVAPDVRVLLVTMWAPSAGYQRIRPFLDCLEEELAVGTSRAPGNRVQLVQRSTYAEANALLAAGGADMGLICTGSSADPALRVGFHAPFNLRFEYGAHYHSALIVQANDPAREIADLMGASVAWTDPDSLTGYRVLRSHLRSQDIDPDRFFGSATFTHSHDRSVDAVHKGVVRAAAVDQEILEEVEHLDALRVLWLSEAFPSPPFLVSKARPELISVLGRVGQRRSCLEGLGANGLVAADWSDYDGVQKVIADGR